MSYVWVCGGPAGAGGGVVEVVCVRARVPGERGVVCAFDVYESALDLLRVVFFELLAGTVVLESTRGPLTRGGRVCENLHFPPQNMCQLAKYAPEIYL